MTVTQDMRFLFAACDHTSELIQIGTETGTVAKHYGRVSEGIITAIVASASSEL